MYVNERRQHVILLFNPMKPAQTFSEIVYNSFSATRPSDVILQPFFQLQSFVVYFCTCGFQSI